jgi:hypothetical protein
MKVAAMIFYFHNDFIPQCRRAESGKAFKNQLSEYVRVIYILILPRIDPGKQTKGEDP